MLVAYFLLKIIPKNKDNIIPGIIGSISDKKYIDVNICFSIAIFKIVHTNDVPEALIKIKIALFDVK